MVRTPFPLIFAALVAASCAVPDRPAQSLAAASLAAVDAIPDTTARVRVANHSGVHYTGWKRVNVDRLDIPTGNWLVGKRTSLDTRFVDLYLDLPPQASETIILTEDEPRDPPRLPDQPVKYLGGLPTFAGQHMAIQELEADGAALVGHFRCRAGRAFVIDLHLTWHPDQPWMTGELIVTNSSPDVPDLSEVAPPMTLRFGDGLILHRGDGAMVTDLGGAFGDGQTRVYPIVVGWLRHMTTTRKLQSFGAVASMGIGAVGIEKLLHDGSPGYPAGFDAMVWARKLPDAIRRVKTWEGGVVGPAKSSGVTGAQEDQVFVRGEPLQANGAGSEWLVYLSALKLANRPSHMLKADGSPWDIAGHTGPRAIMWDGRFHWHTGVSPYQHGKPRQPTTEETHGWYGYDVEHALFATLAAGARYTGSEGCQFILAQVARTYLTQYTTTPGWSTSGPNASRAVGWEGIMAVHLWRELQDRRLAERVKIRWRSRVTDIIIPALEGKTWWDVRTGDQRVWDAEMQGQAGPWSEWAWAMPWQQSIGAYGLDLGCRVLGPAEGIPLALAAAKVCVDRDWVKLPGETAWRNIGNQPALAANRPMSFYTAAWLDGRPKWFTTTWAVPAVEVVNRYEPNNERAAALWAQATSLTAAGRQSWLPPRR